MTTTERDHKAGRPYVLLGVILLGLIVALLAIGIIATPRIVSKIASGVVGEMAGEALRGTGSARVTIGWNSPATIESLTVTDASGRTIADLTVRTEIGLLDAIGFDWDAGTVTIGGSLVLTPESLHGGSSSGGSGGGSAGGSGRAADLSVIRDLIATLELRGFDLTLEDEHGEIVAFDALDATVGLDRGALEASVLSASPEVSITASGEGFVTSAGALDLRAGKARATLDAVLARESVERALHVFGLDSSAGRVTVAQPSFAGDRVVARFEASLEGGLLRVASSSGPSNIPVFDALLGRFEGGAGQAATLETRPSASVNVRQFEIGLLPEGGGLVDLSSGSLVATVTIGSATLTSTSETGERSRVEVSPSEINLTAADLSGTLDVTLVTSFAVDGERTGGVNVTGSIVGPLTGSLGFNERSLRTIRAYADVRRVPSSLLEPLFAGTPYTAAEIIGPVLEEFDLSVESAEGAGPLGDVRLTLSAKSEGFEVSSPELILRNDMLISTTDYAIKIDTLRATTVLRPFVGEEIELVGSGVGAVGLLSPKIPLRDGVWPDLSKTEGEVRLIVGDFAVRQTGADAEPIGVTSLETRLTIAPGAPAGLLLDYRFTQQGRVFDLYSQSTIDNVVLPEDVRDGFDFDLASLRAQVRAKLSNVPVSILALVSPDLADVAGALGGEVVTLTLRPDETTGDLVHALDVETDTGRLTGRTVVDVRDGAATLRDTRFEGELTPFAFELLRNTYAPGVGGGAMSLLATEPYTLTVNEARIALKDGLVPDPESVRNVTASIAFADDVIIKSVERPDEAGAFVDAGLRELVLRYRHDGKDATRREAVVLGTLFDPASEGRPVLGGLNVRSGVTGIVDVDVTLEGVAPGAVDAWLGLGETLGLALGDTAGLEFQIRDQVNPEARAYFLQLGSERLSTRAHLRDEGNAVGLVEPIAAVWNVPARLLERYVRLEDAATGENRLSVSELTPVTLRVDRLVLGPAGARTSSELFDVDASVGVAKMAFSVSGGETHAFENIVAKVRPVGDLGALAFEVSAREAGLAASESASVRADGTVSGLRDGLVTVTMNARGDVPTMLIDAFARTDGAAYDLLGPITTIDLRAAGLSRTSGHALLNVISDHVRGSIEGDANDGVFAAADGARLTVTRISQDISERYLETVLPFLTRFEKTSDDDPAVVVAEGLTLPMDGNMATLNGIVNVDLGTVQFDTSEFFGNVLERTNNNRTGSLGGKVEPFLITINRGVMSYERTKIPTGEFVIETRGTVDLVTNRMEIILYLPFSALSGDLRSAFRRVPGLDGFVGMAPIRIKGAFGSPKVEPALDLVVSEGVPEAAEKVIDNLIKKGLEDLFKK